MSLVLYPDQLQQIGLLFDATCDDLARRGADFSRENLAKRILEDVMGPFVQSPVEAAPSVTYH